MSNETNTSAQVMRVLDLLEALAGYAATGGTNKDLAEAARTSAPNVTRAMASLIAKGWARKDENNGRFYPTAQFTRLSYRVDADFDRMQDRLKDRRQAMTGA